MAFFECNYHSKVLNCYSAFNMVIPESCTSDIPTVLMLHGVGADCTHWTRKSSAERYATERGVALIMPSAGRSFYTDMVCGQHCFTQIADELYEYTHTLLPLSRKREKNFTCGLSMGGYGAFKIALLRPERFSAAVSMSGCLDVIAFHGVDSFRPDTRLIWGDTDPVGGIDDLFGVIPRLEESGAPRPRLLQLCGTEDYLYGQNKKFREFISSRPGYDYTYNECPGAHSWSLWDRWLPDALDFLLK